MMKTVHGTTHYYDWGGEQSFFRGRYIFQTDIKEGIHSFLAIFKGGVKKKKKKFGTFIYVYMAYNMGFY